MSSAILIAYCASAAVIRRAGCGGVAPSPPSPLAATSSSSAGLFSASRARSSSSFSSFSFCFAAVCALRGKREPGGQCSVAFSSCTRGSRHGKRRVKLLQNTAADAYDKTHFSVSFSLFSFSRSSLFSFSLASSLELITCRVSHSTALQLVHSRCESYGLGKKKRP